MTAPTPAHLPVPPLDRAPESTIADAFVPVRWRLRDRAPTYSRCYVFAHLKGGTGKSTGAGTTALRLAEHTGQPVLAIDADTRSKTLTAWRETLGDRWPDLVQFEAWPVVDLSGRINAALSGPNPPVHLVVDCGGHDVMIVQQAITAGAAPRRAPGQPTVRGVDVIMPLAPSDADGLPVSETFEVVSGLGWITPIRFRALLTQVGPGGYNDADYLRMTAALAAFDNGTDVPGLPWFDTYIPYLKKHLRAVGQLPRAVRNPDRPQPDDCGNFDALLAELLADEPLEVIS